MDGRSDLRLHCRATLRDSTGGDSYETLHQYTHDVLLLTLAARRKFTHCSSRLLTFGHRLQTPHTRIAWKRRVERGSATCNVQRVSTSLASITLTAAACNVSRRKLMPTQLPCQRPCRRISRAAAASLPARQLLVHRKQGAAVARTAPRLRQKEVQGAISVQLFDSAPSERANIGATKPKRLVAITARMRSVDASASRPAHIFPPVLTSRNAA